MVERSDLRKVLLLQGGGALGAYECGAYKALEEKRHSFDAVVGVSIGAFNAAIIGGNPPGTRVEALESFWREASIPAPFLPNETLRRTASATYALAFGNPGLFAPRWFNPWSLMYSRTGWTSFYDPSPMKRLLRKHLALERLAKPDPRLFLAAVNVRTGRMELFDSLREELTLDHVMASGALPPAFPWVAINGNAYWDGAMVSNTPLRATMDSLVTECILDGWPRPPRLQVYIVDLFPREGRLPSNLWEVAERHKDILYSTKIESDLAQRTVMNRTLGLVNELLAQVPEEVAQRVRQDPRFVEFLCNTCSVDVVRIAHTGEGREEFHFKDYDFSHASIREHIDAGYRDALTTLERLPQVPPQAADHQPRQPRTRTRSTTTRRGG